MRMASAAQNCTLEWTSGVQPLLASSFAAFNRNDVPDIVKGVIKSEVALLTLDKEFEPFCSSFVALASHYLGGTAPSLPKTHLNGVLAASRVLLRYLLNGLDAQNANGSASPCSLNQSQVLQLIRCLCRGTIGLHKAEVVALTAVLKAYDAKPPPFCRAPVDCAEASSKDKENANPSKSDATAAGTASPHQPLKRPRLGDSTMNLFEQLTSVFHEVIASGGSGTAAQSPLRSIYASLVDNSEPAETSSSTPSAPTLAPAPAVATGAFWVTSGGSLTNQPPPPFVGHLVADPQEEMRMLFANRNIAALKALRGREILLETCSALPSIVRYIVKHEEVMLGSDLSLAGNGLFNPTNQQDAAIVKATLPGLLADVCVVYRTFQLPVLEPLTPSRLHKMIGVTMACLHVALTVTSAIDNFTPGSSAAQKAGSSQQPAGETSASSSSSSLPLAQRSKSVPGTKDIQTLSVPTLIDEADARQLATAIVQRCLEVFNLAIDVVKASSRAGGHVYQNVLLIGCWTLMSGLQVTLNLSNNATSHGDASNLKTTPSGSRLQPQPQQQQHQRKHLSTSDAPDAANLSLPTPSHKSPSSLAQSGGNSQLTVTLVSFAMGQLSILMNDLELEGGAEIPLLYEDSAEWYSPPDSVEMIATLPTDLSTTYTARQRFSILQHGCRIPQLLLGYFVWAFRKASHVARLKMAPKHGHDYDGDGNSSATSDSNTYYEDDFSSSDDSSDEEEPILGQWITETLATASPVVTTSGLRRLNRRRAGKAPEENDYVDLGVEEGAVSGRSGHIHEALVTALFDDASALTSADPDADHAHLIASASSGGGGSFSPTRGSREQIAALVSLAADILNFVEGRFISSEQEDVKRCLRHALGDAELSSLASVLREMDRDGSLRTLASTPVVTSPTAAMGGSLFASAVLSPTALTSSATGGSTRPSVPPFQSFSIALARFTHGLISTQLLDHNKQDHLLHQLGISPVSVDPWPLNVAPRTLSVLAQVLLLRLQPTSGAPTAATGMQASSRSTPPPGAPISASLLDPLAPADTLTSLGTSAAAASTGQAPTSSNVASASMGLKSSAEAAIVNIWVRLLNTLKRDILSAGKTTATEAEDINVEHAQLLLFLFHTLPLMQKKSLLLQLAQTIITVTSGLQGVGAGASSSSGAEHALEASSPLPLTRLLLIFEYLLHNFYDPPMTLLEQVTWNLFTSYVMPSSDGGPDGGLISGHAADSGVGAFITDPPSTLESGKALKLFFPCSEVEDSYQKLRASCNVSGNNDMDPLNTRHGIKPKFYDLGPQIERNPKEPPKVDGLACAFLVGAQDVLNYNLFYDCVIATLGLGTDAGLVVKSTPRLILERCATHYHFLVAWRLLGCLPPSPKYLASLESQSLGMSDAHILHTLRWAPRLASPAAANKGQTVTTNTNQSAFACWAKDWLIKHGMTSQKADALLFRVGEVTGNVMFDVKLAQFFFADKVEIESSFRPSDIVCPGNIPSLKTVYVMDAVVAKVHMAIDRAFASAVASPASVPSTATGNGAKNGADANPSDVAQGLLPAVFSLVSLYIVYAKSSLLHQISSPQEGGAGRRFEMDKLRAIGTTLAVASTRAPAKISSLGISIISWLPPSVRNALEVWNSNAGMGSTPLTFPAAGAWRNPSPANVGCPQEAYLEDVLFAHIRSLSTLSDTSPSGSASSPVDPDTHHPRGADDDDDAFDERSVHGNEEGLRHALNSLVRLAGDLVQLSAPDDVEAAEDAVCVFLPLVLDATTEGLVDFALSTLERVLGSAESDAFALRLFCRLFQTCHRILTTYEEETRHPTKSASDSGATSAPTAASNPSKRRRKSPSLDESIAAASASSPWTIDERVLHEILKFFEMNLDRAPLQDAIAQFFIARKVQSTSYILTNILKIEPNASSVPSMLSMLLSSGNEKLSPSYANKILKFFNRLFQLVQEACPSTGWTGVLPQAMPPPPPPPPVLLPPYVSSPHCGSPTPLVHPLVQLCSSLTKLADTDDARLSAWLSTLILGRRLESFEGEDAMATSAAALSPDGEMFSSASSSLAFIDRRPETQVSPFSPTDAMTILENRALLQKLTNSLVKDSSSESERVCLALLKALIPIGHFMLRRSLRFAYDATSGRLPGENYRPATPTIVDADIDATNPGVSHDNGDASTPAVQATGTGGFPQLMVTMATLAGAGRSGKGHAMLFKAALEWTNLCKSCFGRRDLASVIRGDDEDEDADEALDTALPGNEGKLPSSSTASKSCLESICFLLSYVGELLGALKLTSTNATKMDVEVEQQHDWMIGAAPGMDTELYCFMEGQESADAGIDSCDEDSDEEYSLCNKVCTYTVTQKDFMNQHWYHCHTCKMVDGVGVCTICAKVCHKDHDVTYAKYGSFFCDCGAKNDGSCIALTKRTPRSSGQTGVDNADVGAPAFSAAMQSDAAHSQSLRTMAQGSHDECMDMPLSTWDIQTFRARQTLSKVVELQRTTLVEDLMASNVTQTVLNVLQDVVMTYTEDESSSNASKPSHPLLLLGSAAKASQYLKDLHSMTKRVDTVDNLMTPTLGSQEGAFENVRMNYGGDQGQQIRQLISAHMLRRVAMCVMASPPSGGAGGGGVGSSSRRQHLAVSHEKGKITILQLSALLRQADSSKKKLTLTRLHSAPVPFTALSIASNPCSDDVLAVSGLKDCHVLVFNASGAVAEHIVLHPSLETGNFIIKSMWLPGSQSELAVVTADFVKIYDLATDALSPQYYFLLPTGKIRDASVAYPPSSSEGEAPPTILLMTSSGYVYSQAMEEESSAKHGPFYVTNVLETSPHEELNAETMESGGVSIHYSHALQLLFFSFACGKSFAAPLNVAASSLAPIFPISVKAAPGAAAASTNNKNGGNNGQAQQQQPLVGWGEVPGHPGLVTCLTQSNNNPVILMVKPRSIAAQEIRVTPTGKAKIQDMVAIRHPASGAEHRTTLILLCEDGSLRIYMANSDATNFWIDASSPLHGGSAQLALGLVGHPSRAYGGGNVALHRSSLKHRLQDKSGGSRGSSCGPSGGGGGGTRGSTPSAAGGASSASSAAPPPNYQPPPSFPVDFFESCQQSNDVDFGGRDVLEVYNTQQIKHRLNNAGMYVANTKTTGFTMEIKNPSSATSVMVGIRVQLGFQGVEKAPSYVEVFGRVIQVAPLTKSRWFDIPFTREESLTADRKLNVFFGPSQDASGVNMVDCIRVYVKTKEAFGFPDDPEEYNGGVSTTANGGGGGAANTVDGGGGGTADDNPASAAAVSAAHYFLSNQRQTLTRADRLLAKSLDTVDGALACLASAAGNAASGRKDEELKLRAQKMMALDVTTSLLAVPTANFIGQQLKGVLAALHPTAKEYHLHKDRALLAHAQSFVGYWIMRPASPVASTDPAEEGAASAKPPIKEPQIDPEAFQRILATVRGIAVQRPQNLVAATTRAAALEDPAASSGDDGVSWVQKEEKLTLAESQHFAAQLVQIFWRLLLARPQNVALAPVGLPGLTCVEATVQALVDVIHAFTVTPLRGEDVATSTTPASIFVDVTTTRLAVKLYASLLLCPEQAVSFAAKSALIRILKPAGPATSAGTGGSFGGADVLSRGSSHHDGGGGGGGGGVGGGGSGGGKSHHNRRRPSSDTGPGSRLNRKVFIPSPPRCSTPGATGAGGAGLDDGDEELDDDLDDVMGDEDMDEDDVMQRPFQQQPQQQIHNRPPIDILHVSPGGQDAVLMINPGADDTGGPAGLRINRTAAHINLGDAALMAASNRRGALRASLRGLRGAVGSGRLGGAGRSGARGSSGADGSNNADGRGSGTGRGSALSRAIAASTAGNRSLASMSSRGAGGRVAQQGAAPSSSGRGGGTGRAQRGASLSAARSNDILSVDDLEIDDEDDEADLIPPGIVEDEDDDDDDDDDEDDEDDEDDVDDDDDEDDEEEDEDEDEMVDVIEASSAAGVGVGRSRNNRGLELEEDEDFSSSSSRPGSNGDARSGGPPPPHAIHIPGVVENAIFANIGGGREDEAIVDQVEAMASGSGIGGPSGQVGNVLISSAENDSRRDVDEDAGEVNGGPASALEALLGGRAAAAAAAQLLGAAPPPHPGGVVGFPPILDIPPDADDEAMVELAIALSLQDQGAGAGGAGGGSAAVEPPPPLNLLQNLHAFAEINSNMEEGVDERAVTPPPPPPGSILEPASASSGATAGGGLSVAAVVEHGASGVGGRFSDTTTSAAGSDDDEGSTAATEGSTLRTSPIAEREGAGGSGAVVTGSGRGGSEEGSADGSVSDEDAAVSAGDPSRSGSSACGELSAPIREGDVKGVPGSTSARDTVASTAGGGVKSAAGGAPPPPPPAVGVAQKQLHRLRLMLLEGLLQYMQHLKESGGVRSIPYMQVLLMLSSDLDGSSDQDRQAMDALLKTLMNHMRNFATSETELPPTAAPSSLSADGNNAVAMARVPIVDRTDSSEVDLIIMRFYSVLMTRSSSSKSSKSSDSTSVSNSFTSNATAKSLAASNAIDFCLQTLQQLLPYWKALEITTAETPAANESGAAAENAGNGTASGNAGTATTTTATTPGALIKPHPLAPPPDMSPFFLRQYVKGHANDIFEAYPQLVTEMVLRLPLQIKKLTDGSSSGKSKSSSKEVVVSATATGVTAEEKDAAASGVAKSDAATGGKSDAVGKGEVLDGVVKSKIEDSAVEKATPPPPPPPTPVFNQTGWFRVLCEYMMTQETPFVRRQVRKLLLFICGTKTKYRHLRDLHALETHMKEVRDLCNEGSPPHLSMTASASTTGLGDLHLHAPNASPGFISMAYETRLSLIEHLKACSEIASSRTDNWQKFCLANGGVVQFLITVSYQLDEGVAPLLLQLLQAAICSGGGGKTDRSGQADSAAPASSRSSPSRGRSSTPTAASTEKKDVTEKVAGPSDAASAGGSDDVCVQIVRQLISKLQEFSKSPAPEPLVRFIRAFLLESNATAVRWQAHALLLSIYRCASPQQQEMILELIWGLWSELPAHGRKAAQFVDLLGYFSLKRTETGSTDEELSDGGPSSRHRENKLLEYVGKAVEVLRQQNGIICATHPNANIYTMLSSLVEFDGFYLESDPCLVCNNPEVPFAALKLTGIKVDSRFTTTTQIFKLVGSHVISKINLRIGDLKRTKMVRTINFYYNNRSVQSVVELRNKPEMWHKAKKVILSAGQTDVKFDFPLPIVACNLMIEYSDFYDNFTATTETLQCPRCSASVPANPGVCGNCGENVYQCHKCRSINYDEKDPFLCNACGFCKYAKFDYTLTAKACCAVDPIENEDDRKKALQSINTLLEKADRVYKTLVAFRPSLEILLLRVYDHGSDKAPTGDPLVDGVIGGFTPVLNGLPGGVPPGHPGSGASGAVPPTSVSGGVASVNSAIQKIAQRYCGDCKASFEDLSKIIQKVLATRKELVEYDRKQREASIRRAAVTNSVSAAPASWASVASSPLSELATPGVVTSTPFIGNAESPRGTTETPAGSLSEEFARRRGRCYGCATSSVEHCITLLRALANNPVTKQMLCNQGLVRELIDFNLRRGSPQVRVEVRTLLCILTKDNPRATDEMNSLLMTRIGAAIRGHLSNPELASSVRHEMALLFTSMQIPGDSCWERRLRCVLRLFLLSLGVPCASPVILEIVTLPCLKILRGLITPAKIAKPKDKDGPATLSTASSPVAIDVRRWLRGEDDLGAAPSSFQAWRSIALEEFNAAPKPPLPARPSKEGATKEKKLHKKIIHERYLAEKYAAKWKLHCRILAAERRSVAAGRSATAASTATRDLLMSALDLSRKDGASFNWLRRSLFTPSSRSLRQVAASIVMALAQQQGVKRKQDILDMLTCFLDELHVAGESGGEFLATYQALIKEDHWKYYLTVKSKLLLKICGIINKELAYLAVLEETSLSSDLSLGYTLKALTELLASLVAQDSIKANYKSRGLLATVLNGYLSLRKLVVQRTKLIDETQDKMLELLEDMTSGTESELKSFMTICVETVHKYGLDDYRTPVFVFERLSSIVYPEANDIGEFFLALEKDPQQEDFLQGRMMGNPYSSNEPGLGPLMRDVKNKICQDCELVALLEDDSGMELLVNNKIISLDLPVKEVYKKIWIGEAGNQEGDPMRVVYRMRGLLGDATEDMVESLDTNNDDEIDNEEVFKMAAVLSTGSPSGLEVMLTRLSAVTDLVRGRHLLLTLLKLFSYCVKIGVNRKALLQPHLNAISIMLASLNMVLHAENEALSSPGSGQPSIAEMLVEIMEAIFTEASLEPPERQKEFSAMCGDRLQLLTLLERIYSPHVRAHVPVMQSLMRLVPFLSFGDEEKITALIEHFKQFVDFEKYDSEHSAEETLRLECFCVVTSGILMNANGERLKDAFVEKGVVKIAMDYVIRHAPPVTTYLATDHDDWKDFLSKASLPFVLRLLTGLSQGHPPTQSLLGSTSHCIPVFHKLEQVSTNAAIGSLSENLLEALREHPTVATTIEEIREQTTSEKKRRAKRAREEQLRQLGMKTNQKGQVLAKHDLLSTMGEVMDESGLTCCICREGYKFHPNKVLAIYTYSKRANLEEMETKSRKTQGYSTVSHFNVVHVDCHNNAVRMQRGRDEWESAALQNANTRCNGLLPLWGSQVPESAFANCLARHNTYLQESTGVRDTNYPLAVHDIKLLFLRFAYEKSFSDDTGGGGPESNLHLIPYLFQMVLYVLNTTRIYQREEKNIAQFLSTAVGNSKWIESSFETESPFYWATMSIAVRPPAVWKRSRIAFLERLLVARHAQIVVKPSTAVDKLPDKKIKDYLVYRPAILFFGLVDAFYRILWSQVSFDASATSSASMNASSSGGTPPPAAGAAAASSEASWSSAMSEWIRSNDQAITEALPKLLEFYKDEMLPMESLDEAMDVLGLLGDIPDINGHLQSLLDPLPSAVLNLSP